MHTNKILVCLNNFKLVNLLNLRKIVTQSESIKEALNIKEHPFKSVYPWKTLNDFANILQDNIIYQDKRIIAINKPFGIGIYRPYFTPNPNNPIEIDPARFGDTRFCITDALPLLKKRLNLDFLKISKTSERRWSGILILSKSENDHNHLVRSLQISRRHDPFFMTFWCITFGKPLIPSSFHEEISGIKLCIMNETTKQKEGIITKPTRYSIRKRTTVKIKSRIRILEYNSLLDVTLVELSCNGYRWNFPRVYMANKTSIILGDTRYGARVKTLFGIPIKIHPAHVNRNKKKESISSEVLQRLNVKSSKSIPLMLHFKSINCKSFLGKGKDLLIDNSKLPKHFKYALEKLDLLKI